MAMHTRLAFTKFVIVIACAFATTQMNSSAFAQRLPISAAEARAIAKEAYIYGFPLVDSYRVQHSYFIDKTSQEYKGAWNEIHNEVRVYTPADKVIQTPNSDTPYSMLGADLRTEPLVISVPAVEKERYYALQFIDAYTFNFAYVGSRATGNDAGNYLLAGPNWSGDKPDGIKQVIQSETEFAFVLYRTQLFNSGDLENVKKVQAGYRVQPLSTYLGQPAPKPAAKINFPKPLSPSDQKTSVEFFTLLNFAMSHCPLNPNDAAIRGRMASLGIRGDESFDVTKWSPEIKNAVETGITDAWKEFGVFKTEQLDTRRVTSANLFGTREHLQGRYIYRMAAAALGIYGNSAQEAVYPSFLVDSDGDKLDGTHYRYALRFEADQLPPVNAFWSLTMYELPSSLLVENPINRYLINSSMLPDLKRDEEGGITLYLMHDSPGKKKESNWLPAPKGPFMVVMRLYWPKEEALDHKWEIPSLDLLIPRPDEDDRPDEEVDPDDVEKFRREIKSLIGGIGASTSVTIYEGLPHQRGEKKLLVDELRTKKTVRLHRFPFYDIAIPAKPEVAAKLIALCGAQETFGPYGGAKFCGGFHPDWCVEFKKGPDVYQILVCFGCQEVRLYGPQNMAYSDLDKATMTKLVDILKPLQNNRPKPIKKPGLFGN